MNSLQRKSVRDRALAEAETQANLLPNGHARLRSDKITAILYRCTRERKERLHEMAEFLSAGGRKITYTETLDAAMDALEEKLGVSK